MMKKTVALLLAICMMLSCFVACTTKTPATDTANKPSGSQADTVVDEKGTESTLDVPALLGPGNVTITSVYQNVTFDPNADSSAARIEDVTGYHVQYEMLPAENADEKLMLEATGGASYDIVRCSVSQFNKLYAAGAIMPLNDLLDAYGQDILAGYSDEVWAAVSDSEGTIYGIPYKYASDNELASFLCCRWDLMKAAGITKLPETIDELYDCLKTLKTFYGDQYIIMTGPYLPTTEKNENWKFPKVIASAFGIYNEWMVNEAGEVYYMTEAEGFADMVAFLQKLYAEGLIDAEWAVNTNDSVSEKFTSGRAIISCSSRSGCNAMTPVLLETNGITYDDIAYIGALKGADGTCTYMMTEALSSVSVILKTCKYPADVINWCNLKVQNQLFLNFGVEGTHFTYDADGNMSPIQPAFTEDYANSYWYCNAMDMAAYQKDWPARIRKSEAQWDCWKRVTLAAQQKTPEIFVDNPFKFMNAGEAFTKYNAGLHTLLCDFMVQVISGVKNYDDLASFTNDWKANGGEDVRAELAEYLKTK